MSTKTLTPARAANQTDESRTKPILFSGEMVRAILAGHKTQTRRIVKPQPVGPVECGPGGEWWDAGTGDTLGNKFLPNDRLWVREAWRAPSGWDDHPGSEIFADTQIKYEADGFVRAGVGDGCWGRYRHARFMPAKASRITLEITGVAVHTLEDMSAAECVHEGIAELAGETMYEGAEDARRQFRELWDRINGKTHPHASNPWVWAIAFKVVAR